MAITSTSAVGFRLEGAGYTYRGHKAAALKNLNLELSPGLFFALVGPSGSGKSTLLRLLAGIDRPTNGRVSWGGQEVWAIPPRERCFGVVFQDCPLYPERTVEAVVRFPLDSGRATRNGSVDEVVTETLNALGLLALRNRHPGGLSGGERQRVALARLLVWAPKVMLLDEPLSAVDHERRPGLVRLLHDMQKETGTTVVYVTHDQIDVFSAADKVIGLVDGTVRQCGSPEQIYREPATGLIGRLVGDSSLTLHEARILRKERDAAVVVVMQSINLSGALSLAKGASVPEHESKVYVGLRPEDISVITERHADESSARRWSIRAKVHACYFLGSRYLVTIDAPFGTLMLWHHDRLEIGGAINVSIKSQNLPVFGDPDQQLVGTIRMDKHAVFS